MIKVFMNVPLGDNMLGLPFWGAKSADNLDLHLPMAEISRTGGSHVTHSQTAAVANTRLSGRNKKYGEIMDKSMLSNFHWLINPWS